VLVGSTAMLMGMAVAGTAFAADAPAGAAAPAAAPSTEVVVTGSRIAKRDFQSTSPMVTVSQQQFQNTANVAVEATLNKLPQFAPDQNLTGVQSADVQESATHTIGISTASLRGLGANRNLVLADGQRLQPVNGSLVVDLNSIPSAIIDHVEVVTGGASAVYGADAVSGVVNFILKKNYQGLDVDAQYGVTQAGDGQEFKISTLFGTNFADDKGNVTFGLEHYTRAASYQKNREFYRKGWADPTTATNEFFNTGSYLFGPNTPPSPGALIAVFGAAPGIPGSSFGFFRFNNDSTLAAGTFGSPNPWPGPVHDTRTVDGSHVAYQNFVTPSGAIVQGVKTNQVDDYFITSPLSRWSMYGAAHYDITPDVTAYVRGSFVSTHTATNLFSTPFIGGWSVTLPYNKATDDPASPGYQGPNSASAQHPVPAQLATLLNSQLFPQGACAPQGFPNGLFSACQWTPWLVPSTNNNSWIKPRSTVDDNTVYQMTAGLQGKAPISDWTWELFGSHGQASDYSIGNGYTSLARFRYMLSLPNYGKGATVQGNGSTNGTAPPIDAGGGFGAATVHCTSGFYGALFQNTAPSQDCINAITATTQSRVLEEQNIVEFDTQGTLFHAPAGDVKLSLGADFRDEYVQYTPDILQSTASFLDQVAGVYPTSYESAAISAREGYGELLIPVVKDLPFAKSFNIELGARYSTYTGVNDLTGEHITPPGGWTYKILGDWRVTDWARFRGGYNLAVRSPNAGELFLAKQEVFAGSTLYGDPCTLRSTAPFGAGGADAGAGPGIDPNFALLPPGSSGTPGHPYPVAAGQTAAGAQSAYNVCRSLMGATGANFYYGGNGQTQIAAAPAPFGFENQIGNQKLGAEKAHTWTAGLVLGSPWHSNPWVSNLRGSVDYFNIKINGGIQLQAVDEVKAACYGGGNPAAAACQLVNRIPGNGQEDVTTVQYTNESTIWTSGLDFEIDDGWNFEDLGLKAVPGRLQMNWLLSYLFKYDTQASHAAGFNQIYHWAGTLGPSLNGVDPGSSMKYKMNTTFTYLEGPFSVSLNWRFTPHTHDAAFALYQVQPGGLAACDKTVNCNLDHAAYHVFDLSATYTVMHNYVLRAGIDNLFDKNPPAAPTTGIHGTCATPNPSSGYCGGGTLASDGYGGFGSASPVYDALGRRFYIGLNAKF
jgi:outer membrane receptor protein involved in Fe transport